jgi:hypothetical protein
VQRPSRVEGNSLVYITTDCATESDFSQKIDGLIGELEEIRAKAHKKFKDYYIGR